MSDSLIILVGVAFNIPLGYLVYRKDALTKPYGLLVAGLLGMVLVLTHPVFWLILIAFFGSSTFLTNFKTDSTEKKQAMTFAEKSGKRDAIQVLANGGLPLILATYLLFTNGLWNIDLTSSSSLFFVVALAVVTADTWATELGVLSSEEPYWILNPSKTVPRGSSGGVSPLGILSSIMGAIWIATTYSLSVLILDFQISFKFIFLIIVSGLLGSLIDSLLGATIQVQYFCNSCVKITEQIEHSSCGTKTTYHRGYRWISNDMVNFLSVLATLFLVWLFTFIW